MIHGGVDGFASISPPPSAAGRTASIPTRCSRRSPKPLLREARLIAEPGRRSGGYRLGAFGPGLGRMGTTAFATPRGASGAAISACAARSRPHAGSRDVFGAPLRRRRASTTLSRTTPTSLNPLSTRGSTTRRMASNRDGTDANYSWNYGVEGPTEDPAVSRGARDQRNLLTLLFASRGERRCWRWERARLQPGRQCLRADNATTAFLSGAPPTPR